jgi:hypothetical protein
MSALKKREDGGAPLSQSVTRSPDSGICLEVNQTSVQHCDCVVTPSSGNVDFRQVQVELRFIALRSQSRLAKIQCSGPLPLGSGDSHTQKGKVVGVLLLKFRGAPQMFKGSGRLPVAQKFDSLFEFSKSRIFRHCSSSVDSPVSG